MDSIGINDQYGSWTDPPHLPEQKPKRKPVVMRWLDPEWSIVSWVKQMFTDEDEAEAEDQYRAQ